MGRGLTEQRGADAEDVQAEERLRDACPFAAEHERADRRDDEAAGDGGTEPRAPGRETVPEAGGPGPDEIRKERHSRPPDLLRVEHSQGN